MAQGFLAGLVWGGVAGVGLLAVSTQVIVEQEIGSEIASEDSGQPEATPVEVPAGTEFDQARQATDPVIPSEETRPGGEAVSDVAPPSDIGITPPAFDTSALEMPQPIEVPGALGEVPEPAEEVTVDVTGPGESAPEIAPLEPLPTPEVTAPAPETETEAPEIAAPGESGAESPEVIAGEQDAPQAVSESGVTAPEIVADAPAPVAVDDAPEAPEVPDAIAAPEKPEASEAPVITADAAPVLGGGEDAPSRPGLQTAAPVSEPQVPTQDAPEAPVVAEVPEPQPEPEPEPETEPEETQESVQPVPSQPEDPVQVPDVTVEDPLPVETPSADVSTDESAEDETPAEDDAPEAAPEVEADVAGSEDEPSTDTADTQELAETEATEPRIRPAPGQGGSLPRVIRLIDQGEDEPVAEIGDDEPEEEIEIDPNAGALERFRVRTDIAPGDAILSLVILHQGGVPDAGQLQSLPEGLSFAVEAGAEDAEAVAAAYRDAGREVVLIPNLPERARPQDVEQAMQANLRSVPEAVAVMDTTGGGFQSDREAVAQVVDAIGATGHGLITFPRGLNSAHQRAEREGVPRGLIFRDIDGKGEGSEEIGRSLDRAAFRARQSRQPVILVGRFEDGTLAAVTKWAVENAEGGVALAPVSAALLAGN